MSGKNSDRGGYDFKGKNPNDVLTPDEKAHLKEGMRLRNLSVPAETIDFAKAAKSVARDLDRLLP